MARRTVSFSLAQGRRDRVDPKLAPFGVLATARNLRVRKDGRLACRNGYTALDMRTSGGTLVAYDLHEYHGRLVALGAHSGSGYPERPYEYTGIGAGNVYWRYETDKQELTPFVDLRDIAIMSPPCSGADMVDSACGAGYVLVVTRSTDLVVTAVCVRESDNQPILTEVISTTRSTRNCRVTFAVDSFYIASQRADNSVDILSFNPTSHTAVQVLVSQANGSDATIAEYDIAPVENPTTGRIVYTRDRGSASTLLIRIYNSSGSQVGSDITLAATTTTALAICADQTADRIHLACIVSGGAGSLRTYNFSGSLLLGSTATTSGDSIAVCRIPATAASGAAAQAAVAVATSSGNTVVQYFSEAAHAATASTTVFQAVITTRLLPWVGSTSTNANNKYAVVFGGYVAPDVAGSDDFASNALFFTASGANNGAHLALRDYTRALPGTLRNVGLHLDSSTGRVTWCAMRDSGSGSAMPAITTFPRHSTARRQAAKFGDLLYIAGAPLQVYDGRCLTEPFQELPGIISATPSNGSGSLTPSAEYDFVVHWEMTLADGSFWVSAPSLPASVTMTSSDDTVTLVNSTPHLLTTLLTALGYGPEVTEVVSRTVWDGAKGTVFRRSVSDNITGAGNDYGAQSTIDDTTSDTDLADQEALYTQADRGPYSGPLENNGPQACKLIAATESRLLLGGLLRSSKLQMSKEAFLDEPFTFSEFSAFFSQVAGGLRGIASLDGARLIFTADEIFAFFGEGPDDIGGGTIGRAQDIPTPSGLKDWRSLLKGPDGLYFQLDDDKIYRMPRGGGAPEWVGVDVLDTLTSYPVVTGACKSRRDDAAVFAIENSGSSDGLLLVRSFRTGIWTVDAPPLQASQGIEAVVSYGDSIAYLSGGTVYVQSTGTFSDGGAVIPTQWKTEPLYPFGLGGYGSCWGVLITGEFRSPGTLALRVSYDDGVSFTSYDSFSLTTGGPGGYTTGATVQKRWDIQQSDFTSLVFEWTYTPSTAGEGFIIQDVAFEVDGEEGLKAVLAADRA